ncbi:MAG: preprotein translocase subunit Sec61beta [Candidatus Nanoarchaeia archaeon]
MAKDNKINMPSSGAGLTRYFDDEKSNIMISPQATVIIILIVVALVLVFTGF